MIDPIINDTLELQIESYLSGRPLQELAADYASTQADLRKAARESIYGVTESSYRFDTLGIAYPIDIHECRGKHKIIYMYRINDGNHTGRIKIGEATYHTDKTMYELMLECDNDNGLYTSDEIKKAGRRRIDQQTRTAEVVYEFIDAYLAIRPAKNNPNRAYSGGWEGFEDKHIHSLLKRSRFDMTPLLTDKISTEWMAVNEIEALRAIRGVMEHRNSLRKEEFKQQIELRPEQRAAVEKILGGLKGGTFKNPKRFLVNAIMRFGKTLVTFEVIKQLVDRRRYKKILILTHRPVVLPGWAREYDNVFTGHSLEFASRLLGETWDSVVDKKFVYFTSVQDMRGSLITAMNIDGETAEFSVDETIATYNEVTGVVTEPDFVPELTAENLTTVYNKNKEVFETEWDLVVLDEAHEGLKTELAQEMLGRIKSKRFLHLSGTPYNIIDDFDAANVYSWTYLDEQRAKENWDYSKGPNPYGDLPKLEIKTIDLHKTFADIPELQERISSVYFNFNKFFELDKTQVVHGRVYDETNGGYYPFKNPFWVNRLLDLLTDAKSGRGEYDPLTGEYIAGTGSEMPFATERGWIKNADTLWVLNSVDATKALQELMALHPAFCDVKVVNATGNNDSGDPLKDVENAISAHDRTITLSVGKLTLGTTIPEWTGVLELHNGKSVMSYLQTIFRAKSPGKTRDGEQKQVGTVYDFSPERALEMAVQSSRNMNNTPDDAPQERVERELVEFLQYLPLLAYDGSKFDYVDSKYIMRTLKRVFIDSAVNSGLDSKKLFNMSALSEVSIQESYMLFSLGRTKAEKGRVTLNGELQAKGNTKPRGEKTPTSTDLDEQSNADVDTEVDEQVELPLDRIVDALRTVTTCIPMLVLGMPHIDPNAMGTLTTENFPDFIDDASWVEFMPKGFSKTGLDEPSWESIHKYLDSTVFIGAVVSLQERVAEIQSREPLDRVLHFAHLFSTFKNPDKETVLTPWHVVNLQYAQTFGGLVWTTDEGLVRVTEEKYGKTVDRAVTLQEYVDGDGLFTAAPVWVDSENSELWNSDENTVFDIASKTGLYPLFAAASFTYRGMQREEFDGDATALWNSVVSNQVYVNALTSASRVVTERLLRGYNEEIPVNVSAVDVLAVRAQLKEMGFYKTAPKQKKSESDADYVDRLEKWERHGKDSVSDVWRYVFNMNTVSPTKEML